VAPIKVGQNIKASYNQDCYARGEEMPFGLIALLPLSAYFPGDPVSAFHYILEIDFFDIKDADLYPAAIGAILADLLGGTSWEKIMKKIEGNGLEKYLKCEDRQGLQRLQHDVNQALSISKKFKNHPDPYGRENYNQFIKALHQNFAVGEVMMCTVDEMFSVTLAIMDYAPRQLKQIIEMAVNYGRDNDTVASIVACYGGAILGIETIPGEWKKIVENANGVDFKSVAESLSFIKD
jgi:ADP-ribosylglycohydrolase